MRRPVVQVLLILGMMTAQAFAEPTVEKEEPSGKSAQFQMGFRVTADEDVFRFGLKGLVRIPLDDKSRFYFQFAPGIYLAGSSSSPAMNYPGVFAELELGYTRMLALVLAVEYLPYTATGLVSDGEDHVHFEVKEEFIGGYVGLKLGQLPGGLALLGLLVAGGIAAATYSGIS